MELGPDVHDDEGAASHDAPRYLSVEKLSSFSNEKEYFFSGQRVKFRITNIIESSTMKHHRRELTLLNKIQQLVSNGAPVWKPKELEMFEEFCEMQEREYVLHDFSLYQNQISVRCCITKTALSHILDVVISQSLRKLLSQQILQRKILRRTSEVPVSAV